jgi:glycosyltransferase involved in cell wall biosynthesis
MQNKLISVLIPTYNRADYLVKAIDSVLAQTYRDFEIIVIDDGSTDCTSKHLFPYAEQIRYIYQPNKGKSAALNRGLGEVKGNWIAFLDSDDLWLPEKLEWQIKAIERYKDNCSVCFTDGKFIGDPSLSMTLFQRANNNFEDLMGIIDEPISLVLNPLHGIYEQTMLVKKDLISQIEGFDEKLTVAEDTDFIFRLSLMTKFCFINIPLINIDRSPKRVGLVDTYLCNPYFALKEKQYMYEKWVKHIEQSHPQCKKRIMARLREVHYQRSKLCLLHGKYFDALRAFLDLTRLTIRNFLG